MRSVAKFFLFQYEQNKSFAEDLTEGKFSFPLIHAVRSNPSDSTVMSNSTSFKLLSRHLAFTEHFWLFRHHPPTKLPTRRQEILRATHCTTGFERIHQETIGWTWEQVCHVLHSSEVSIKIIRNVDKIIFLFRLLKNINELKGNVVLENLISELRKIYTDSWKFWVFKCC